MPKSRQNHRDQEVPECFPFPAGAATQGDVQVVAQPGAQTNVPATPKILQPGSQKRLPEINHEMETHQLSTATRDIAIAAEVTIHLPRKRVGPDQNNPEVWRAKLPAKRSICQQRAVVCNHALTHETGKNQHQTVEKPVGIKGAFLLDLRE